MGRERMLFASSVISPHAIFDELTDADHRETETLTIAHLLIPQYFFWLQTLRRAGGRRRRGGGGGVAEAIAAASNGNWGVSLIHSGKAVRKMWKGLSAVQRR
jgi:hypothetical protein